MDRRLALALVFSAACIAARADEPDTEATSTPIAPPEVEPDPWLGDEEPLLSGPRLNDTAQDRTLVRFEFNGNLRRLDRTPEEAALNALNLPSKTRDEVDEIVRADQTALDEYVRTDLDVLVLLQSARQAGNKPEAAALVAQLSDRTGAPAGPIRLRDRLARVLPEAERREFQRMIDEYWRAIVLDEMQQAQIRKEKMSLQQARIRITLNSEANEIRRAFERRCSPREEILEQLIEALNLTAEQNEKVRKPIESVADRTKSKPNARDLYDLSVRVVPILDASQRLTWSRFLLGVSPIEPDIAKSAG